jgi:hypothetical protein
MVAKSMGKNGRLKEFLFIPRQVDLEKRRDRGNKNWGVRLTAWALCLAVANGALPDAVRVSFT